MKIRKNCRIQQIGLLKSCFSGQIAVKKLLVTINQAKSSFMNLKRFFNYFWPSFTLTT